MCVGNADAHFLTEDDMKEKVLKILKIAPLIVMAVLAILFLINKDKITVDEIISFTPENKALAIIVLWALFAIKSVSVFMPNPLIMMAAGIMFDTVSAIIISSLGYAICVTIPYLIGRFSAADTAEKMRAKHRILNNLDDVQKSNVFWMNAATRQLVFFPCDLISLYMGAMRTKYLPYMLGSVVGYVPNIAIYCILGGEIKNVGSPQFFISVGVSVVLTTASVIMYVIKLKKKRAAEKIEDTEEVK